jgi:hypothetical protein
METKMYDDATLALTGLHARTREEEINRAMNYFLNNNYKKFDYFVVRDSEASVWMLMNESLVLSANMNLQTRETAIDMLHQQIIYGGTEIQTTGATKRPIPEMKRLKSILEERINKTNKAISYLHSNSQNVNELIPKYSLRQCVEMEHMLHHNLLRNRYPPDMIPFINDVLLPQLRLEIQAKIIDVAAEERKSEGGFKRSANKRSANKRSANKRSANKSMKCKKSRKTKSRRH